MLEKLKGKRTYILAALLVVVVLVPVVFKVQIPEQVFAALAALGVGAVRLALMELSENHGWKTFAAVGIVLVVAVCQSLNVALPYDLIYSLAGVFGLVGIRNAVDKLK
jgi:hypothetical protein